MSEIREFKTESKRLLELMINSIYTNKEIFLRELISNASDAMDKHHYLALTDDKLNKVDEYQIFITANKKKKTLSITDNGIGMTHDEVVNNLGTIAQSGSLEFMKSINEKSEQEKLDIIGQFGIGFYSSYMVAEKVVVTTRSAFDKVGYTFSSNGVESYEIVETEDLDYGTTVTLHFRKDTENDKFVKYL
ncbi:MAG TPA: ATP-binding protein, partial [Bacilli bacterium]|nr:ATP-binding protein [Bacilli bacterium]